MSLSLSLRRLGIAVAAGALVSVAAVTPAVADGDWGDEDPGVSRQDDDGWNQQGDDNFGGRGDHDHQGDHDNPRLYRGVVTADQLALRSRPDRGSRVIRYAYRGEHVSIFCKTGGSNVQGNPLWYLLTDGTWAWGSARYIDNIGPAPRWC
ncbi:SH3 domain-containing protein [Streptomyces sp. NBC_01239]|uniref:SH3 domain-containing protein n=1 Tax=Streptomyces sp. NBC_01239 TaxID=2903792 RepID=UPI0022554FC2|nr:SH3 domain-containing protein [Streptomyces sp. NBC_01239]MCX4813827.1 SH3 domain-containing protein [Streptomyces sp. NBC_01239]